MADRPQDQIDLNELLASFASENAKMTQRAIVAEARCDAKDRIIDALAEDVARLKADLEAREALFVGGEEVSDGDTAEAPSPEPTNG